MMIGQEKNRTINQNLNNQLEKKKVLIAVHRGSSAGNIIENTIPAYLAAIQMGGDILEVDVIQSKDKYLYAFHHGMERKNFQKDFDIREKTRGEIENLSYINSNLEKTEYPVEKLANILRYFKGTQLINIDRAWDFFPEVCELLIQEEVVQQIILKGPLTSEIIAYLSEHSTKFMFMPKIEDLEQLQMLSSYQDINIVGVEIKVPTENSYFFKKEHIAKIKKNNLFVWINALTIDDEKKLFAGKDDNLSITQNAENGWGVLLEKGADVIQTDWPSLLLKYKKKWIKKNEIL